jgi:hypothetical protein
MKSGIRLPLLHCGFRGCTWTADFNDDSLAGGLGHWTLEWVIFLHLMDQHKSAFTGSLIKAGFHNNVPLQQMQDLSMYPKCCEHRCKQDNECWQDDIFLRVYSDYAAALAAKERESMPLIGIAKDRQVLRPLNKILDTVQAKICIGCAQIYVKASLWSFMYYL